MTLSASISAAPTPPAPHPADKQSWRQNTCVCGQHSLRCRCAGGRQLPQETGTDLPEPVSGLGVGFAGLVDSRRNRVTSTNGKYEDAPV